MKCLVTHPGIQHAHKLAEGLHQAGLLHALWSGNPLASGDTSSAVTTRLRRWVMPTDLPPDRRRHAPIYPALRRLTAAVTSPSTAYRAHHQLMRIFDARCARALPTVGVDAVVAFETAAVHTFRAAKAAGLTCILDAAAIHHRVGTRLMNLTPDRARRAVDAQKDEEVRLADIIITCSPLAAATYAENGVPIEKLHVCPLGTELPAAVPLKRRPVQPVRFIFVGGVSRLKGIDTLLAIFETFARDGVPCTLTLLGGIVEADLARQAGRLANVTHIPFQAKADVYRIVADHHCLVLPSRFDSFGMVVPEAMAVGVPVVLSEAVGAKCILDTHPHAGWVVPGHEAALRDRLRSLALDPTPLVDAGRAASRAARDFTWDHYKSRVATIVRDAVGARAAA